MFHCPVLIITPQDMTASHVAPCHQQYLMMFYFPAFIISPLQDMTASQLTSMLVGCAKLRHYDQQLCSLLAAAAVTAMPSASGAQVAQMAWALAHLKLDMPEVFAAAAQQVRLCFVHESSGGACLSR
jgi:hypothetical protein